MEIELVKRQFNRSITKVHTEITNLSTCVAALDEKMEESRWVKVNGSSERMPRDEFFSMLLRATKPERSTRQLSKAFKDWQKDTKLGRVASSKPGKAAVGVGGVFSLLSALHALGLEAIDPVGLTAKILTFIVQLLTGKQ